MKLYIPRFVPRFWRRRGDSGAVKEAARLLAPRAERPVIVVDRAARTPNGIKLLVELAETLQAPVVDMGGRMNFLSKLTLSAGQQTSSDKRTSLLEWSSRTSGEFVNSYIDNGDNGVGFNEPRIKSSNCKLISINSVELNTKANYQDFQRFSLLSTSRCRPTRKPRLPALIDAVKSAIPDGREMPQSPSAAMQYEGLMPRRVKMPGEP